MQRYVTRSYIISLIVQNCQTSNHSCSYVDKALTGGPRKE